MIPRPVKPIAIAHMQGAGREPKGPWVLTSSGRAFDLLDPRPEMVDFTVDIPESLARIARFNGHVRSGPYSVAQHCVIGARALFSKTGSRALAACFLLHDAHEAYIGDLATPVSFALARLSGGEARASWMELRARIDRAIAAAAFPDAHFNEGEADAAFYHASVKAMDISMLRMERDQLMPRSPWPWVNAVETAEPLAMKGKLVIWPWPRAADEWRQAFKDFIPDHPQIQ